MTTWSIPAKTFLVGEYAAIAGAPAILLTTAPCFEITLSDIPGLHGIHPESPAGRLWETFSPLDVGLTWHDPYHGSGGMGASSAQFLGAYLASMRVQKKAANQEELLETYRRHAWHGNGLRPSGYDVLAQSQQGCVYIDKQKALCHTFSWPFPDLAFILLHTGKKLATHAHLKTRDLPSQVSSLANIVDRAKNAFLRADSQRLIDSVNDYHCQLEHMDFVAEHSLNAMASFRELPDVLAVKGCGAMGADVILMLVPARREEAMCHQLITKGWSILATNTNLYTGQALI